MLGRRRAVINRGGNKILPAEIERLLASHPAVQDSVVLGVPDPVMGQVPCAWVIPRPGARVAADDLATFLAESGVARYKIPAHFRFTERFPLLGNGKIDRPALLGEMRRTVREADRGPAEPGAREPGWP